MPCFKIVAQNYVCQNLDCRDPTSIHKSSSTGKISIVKRSAENKEALVYGECGDREELICFSCSIPLTESILDRVGLLKQTHVMRINATQILRFEVLGRMVNQAEIGDLVQVSVRFMQKYHVTTHKVLIDRVGTAYNIAKTVVCLEPFIKSEELENLTGFRRSCRLVSMYASQMVDPSVWRKLRLTLLLSIVSMSDDKQLSDPIHVLICSDAYSPLLLRFIKASRDLHKLSDWSNENTCIPTITSKAATFPPFGVKNSIFLVPIDQLGKAGLKQVTEWTNTKFQKRASYDAGHSLNFHWNSSVIGWLECTNPKVGKARMASRLPNYYLSYASCFDLVLNLNAGEANDGAIDEILSFALLSSEIEHSENADKFPHGLKRYLERASLLRVEIPKRIQDFLTCYVNALRAHQSEQEITHSIDRLVSILQKLSISHAKLCLNKSVTLEDAAVAIMLVENSVAFVNGYSVLGYTSQCQDGESSARIGNEDFEDIAVESLRKITEHLKASFI